MLDTHLDGRCDAMGSPRAVLLEQGESWRRTFEDAPALLDLPTDRPRHVVQNDQPDRNGSSVPVELDEGLTSALKALGRRHGASLSTTLLAGWCAILGRLASQDDVVIGAALANRLNPSTVSLGNALLLRVDLSGEPAGGELLRRVKERILEAQQHPGAPLALPALDCAPPFRAMFVWRNDPAPSPDPTAGERPGDVSRLDLTLDLVESGGRVVGTLDYAAALFDRETIERHLGYLRRLLEGMAADDARTIDRLPILGEAERHRLLVDWNATDADFPREKCVHQLFEAQAARTPDAVAVVCEDARLTYAGLNAKANRLARHLVSVGVKPDDRVAICVGRSLEMVIGLLGVLKSGGAYVPLDPAYPVERLAHMIEDSAPIAVLTHGPARDTLEQALAGQARRPPVIDLEADAETWAGRDSADVDVASLDLKSGNLAYVI